MAVDTTTIQVHCIHPTKKVRLIHFQFSAAKSYFVSVALTLTALSSCERELQFSRRLWRKEADEEEDTLLSLSFLLMAASLAL